MLDVTKRRILTLLLVLFDPCQVLQILDVLTVPPTRAEQNMAHEDYTKSAHAMTLLSVDLTSPLLPPRLPQSPAWEAGAATEERLGQGFQTIPESGYQRRSRFCGFSGGGSDG